MLLFMIMADLFLPPPRAKILKDFGNPATLFSTVYGSCANAIYVVLKFKLRQVICSCPRMLQI